MPMITKLTKEQESKLNEYYEKWLAVGRDITSIDKPKLFNSLDALYKELNYKHPLKIVVSSPFSCLIAYSYLAKSIKIHSQIVLQIDSKIDLQIASKIASQIASQIDSQIASQIDSQIVLQIDSKIASQIYLQIYSQIRSHIDSQIHLQIGSAFDAGWWYGQHNANWVGHYNFYRDIFGFMPENSELQNIIIDITKNSHWFLPFENLVIISERPIEMHLNSQGRLHKDGGMALQYADGWGLYRLNGISVSKEIVETPAEKLDVKLILNEQNADIQREIIKKIGVERVLKKLNAECLDKWTDPKTGKHYELLRLKAGSIDRKYLYYKHFSLDYYYAKPVPPEITKAIEARAWIIKVIERGDIGKMKDYEIEANLPRVAS